jgi:hypothetical protein
LAGAVGYGLAAAGAGFLVTEPRWHLHADGWPTRVELGRPTVLVDPGHPWAGQPGVELAGGVAVDRTVAALVEVAAPIVEACRRLCRVGLAGLWNEVGDGLGSALAFQFDVPVTPAMVAVLEAAVRAPGSPWRAVPDLRFAEASFGTVHVVQKGGCCLAYTCTDGDGDGDGEAAYCSTCSLRDPAECDAQQVAWLEGARPAAP